MGTGFKDGTLGSQLDQSRRVKPTPNRPAKTANLHSDKTLLLLSTRTWGEGFGEEGMGNELQGVELLGGGTAGLRKSGRSELERAAKGRWSCLGLAAGAHDIRRASQPRSATTRRVRSERRPTRLPATRAIC